MTATVVTTSSLLLICVVIATSNELPFSFDLTAPERVSILRQAAAALDRRDSATAEKMLQPLITSSTGDPLALNLLGLVRLQQQQPAQAEELFRRAIRAGPRLSGPHINLALLLAGSGREPEAFAELETALGLSPANEQAQKALRTVAIEAALRANRTGDQHAALAMLERARKAIPNDAELCYSLGITDLQAGSFRDAKAAFETALAARPGYAEARYALARAQLALNNGPEAEKQMRLYLDSHPTDASAQYGLGYILMAEQKIVDARTAFQKSIALQPRQTESLFQLGLISVQEGNDAGALDTFQKVLSRDPKHAGALTELGTAAFRAHQYDDAARYLDQAVANAPGYQKAHYYRALTLAKLGYKEDAQKEFAHAAELKAHQAALDSAAAFQ